MDLCTSTTFILPSVGMFSGLSGLSAYLCMTGLETGGIFLLDDIISQAAGAETFDKYLIFNRNVVSINRATNQHVKRGTIQITLQQQHADIITKLYCTVRVKDSGLYKRGFNHFKPPEKLSHKHQVVTLQNHTHMDTNTFVGNAVVVSYMSLVTHF